jgi:tRNA (guanine-N7-)-methyltransferase
LGIYGEVLAAAGELHFKTDSREFFDYSVESFVDNGWEVTERSYDLHWSELPESYRVMTSYEARFVGEGKRICFLTAKPLVVQKKLT